MRVTEVFIAGRTGVDYSYFNCPVLLDLLPGAGPLAGIERGMAALAKARLLVLAVDLPAMTAALLNVMAAASPEHPSVIPRLNGRIEPLAAFFPKASLRLAQIALRSNNYSVTAFSRQRVYEEKEQWTPDAGHSCSREGSGKADTSLRDKNEEHSVALAGR